MTGGRVVTIMYCRFLKNTKFQRHSILWDTEDITEQYLSKNPYCEEFIFESDLYKEVDDLWKMPNEERSKIIDELPAYKGPRITMDEEELQKLKKSGFANFGNHTHDHVMSDKCTKQELSAEIDKCSMIMKNITI